MTLLFENCMVLPMTAASAEAGAGIFTGWVGIAGNRIVLVTERAEEAEAFRAAHPDVHCIDGRGRVLMPGLIDTHCHAAMTLQRNRADDIPLMRWLYDHIWPFESKQRPEEVVTGTRLGIAELLLGGVTSFVDMYYWENHCIEPVHESGIRALLGCNYFDSNIEEVFPQMEEAVARAARSGRVRVAVAPHSAYMVSPDNLVRGKEFARRHGLRFMTHVSETQDEMRIIRERYGCSPVEHLDRLGLLDDQTIAAHCVHVDERDQAILVERGVAVSHNPQSNMKISSGVAPIERMLQAGALVTIGTDGPCSNNDLDMWEEMRSASFLQKSATGDPCSLPAYELLKMATVNGARALGYGNELGVIRPGALADVILIDLQKPHLQPVNELIPDLVYCAKAADVETVVVDGELLVEGGRLLRVDLPALFSEAREAVRAITERA